MERSAGILLHPTSLPGAGPCGDLGKGVDRFLEWLEAAGIGLWQVLPLGPVGYGDSPYTPTSAFAGNPLLLSLQDLRAEGWPGLPEEPEASGEGSHCDFAAARQQKERALDGMWAALRQAPATLRQAHHEYLERHRGSWLDDWALYSALKERFDQREWSAWPRELALRQSEALERARNELAPEIDRHRFVQFLFDRQWTRVRQQARRRGIRILGDLPIYPALDSADVWSHQQFFDLDPESGAPRTVAGVPPDYFSATGQLWGNPLYLWERLRADGFRWWVDRLQVQLERADLLRIDHFRGLQAFWQVPAEAATAESGHWQPGPGAALFEALESALGELPLVAEDLGLITAEVEDLRDAVGLPGMRVLQFAFDEPRSDHLPHTYPRHCVAYTGTHDNDTTQGWFASASREARRRALTYTGGSAPEIHWAFVRAVWTSAAALAVAPIQDLLGLGTEARLNQPGRAGGNWTWRLRPEQLSAAAATSLRELSTVTARLDETIESPTRDTPRP